MAIHTDIAIVLNQHLQTARAAVLNAQQLSRCNCPHGCAFRGGQVNAIVECSSLGRSGMMRGPNPDEMQEPAGSTVARAVVAADDDRN
jgi:hypothetical protein